jgi:metal-dependent hydrolase (beta-lactamase superfamily II)
MNAVTHLQPAVCMTGESPRSLPPEAPAGTFFLGTSCTISDPLPNHQAPAFETADALVHFPRCSHAGVRNTLSCALSHSRPGRLRAIVGGMHRAATPPEVVALRADAIEELHPQLICPCHCNGDSARDYLKGRFPDAFQTASTGCALALNAGSESFGRMYAG